MPALIPTDHYAEVTWIGCVADQDSDIRSAALDGVDLTWDGVPGEFHGGRTRPACVRVKDQHAEGTEIANVRQMSIVSAEEIAAIADEIGIDAVRPEWLGASLVLKGIDDFSRLPPSSRLQTEAGTALIVDMENRPCIWPAKELEKDHPGLGKRFKPAAAHRRGVTAWVERPGPLRVGDRMRLHVPDQRPWLHLEGCLSGKSF
ncbi:MOSC domain-containing protein [Roseovarius sp. B08]|uniref:MOSC domain-containing protein n=1 Tax=Roseovarius sp. B08 TaxID=3449223 RepID=UPI003EDB79CE